MEYLSINSKDKHKTVSQTLAKLSFQPLRNSRRLRSTKLSATRPKDDRYNLSPQGQ